MFENLRRSLGICLCLVLAGCQPPQARFVKQVEWTGKGQWLKADLHTHTKFSDGSHSVAEVVDQAAKFECQVVAITDHASQRLTAATKPYFEEIQAARSTHPEMLILAGLEWNVPPRDGREHVKLLMPKSAAEGQLLAEFKAAFDDYKRDDHPPERADQALRWLAEHAVADGIAPVVIYNHPNRKRDESSEFVTELLRLRAVNGLIVGFEGGSGHQRGKQLGGYNKKQELIDRWDPAVAKIGDAWDQLLAAGLDVWGAEASSDFHNASPQDLHDYWPGEFSETWVYAPERSAAGVLRGLQAGSYFGVHGHIAREARIQVSATDLPRPAEAGEVIAVRKGNEVQVTVTCQPSPTDWDGKPNSLHSLELIAIDETGAKEIANHSVSEQSPTLRATVKPTGKWLVLRARGRRVVDDGPDLMFYTNPVRIVVE